jgi:glycosyltransferase involved in cell wall biosynthesis
MKICLISVEIFAWGKYGGFGRATRIIGRELVKRGHDVYAVVPRRKGQREVESLDGIKVYGFSPFSPWSSVKFFKECDADIYHSCEPSTGTYLARRAMPNKKHMVTFRDPRDFRDWIMEFDLPSLNKLQVVHNYFYESNILVKKSIQQMNGVFTIGKYLIPKVKKMYKLQKNPIFLPTPVEVPGRIEKSKTPVVCYLARMDKRKRPELFLDLAEKFPHVEFIAMGKSRNKLWDSYLRKKYSNHNNLEMTGFVDQFNSDLHSKILEKSWIMINTATREALPNAFIEAAAHRCAIMSHVNPDGFASEFGYHAKENEFEKGIEFLIGKDRWKERGEKGYRYIQNTFEINKAIENHINIYKNIIE